MTNKKGISLITLIITIVVVIILAAVVIITLSNNNPINSSKLASLLKSKETMEECIKIVVTDKVSKTLGQTTVKDIITTLDDTEIVDNSVETINATKDGESLILYRVDANDYKNKFGVILSNTPSTNSKWYVDEKGRMFLVYDFIENVPEFMKDDETTLNKSVESFVIVLGQELEDSILENAQIVLPSTSVGIGEGMLSVNLSSVQNLSYCKWVINNSSEKLGTENEELYPNTLESNEAEISLSSITEEGSYFLHMLIATDTSKVEKISSKIVVEKLPDVWDGTVATSFASGSGTELDPYIIETAEELAYFASQVNSKNVYSGEYIKLVNSLDLDNIEWTPIGYANSTTTAFQGNFDGGNNCISNLSITKENHAVGLFGICENATIKNLTIESGSINIPSDQSATYIGAIAASMEASEISNCVNKASITASASYSIGGIIGSLATSSSNTAPVFNVTNCYNYGDITLLNSPNRGGAGIVCYANGKLNMTNCGNYANIYGESASQVSGVVSYLSMATDISKCFNEGQIYGKSEAAGIAAACTSSKKIEFNQCYNTGNITTTTSKAAGIASFGGNSITINYCYNTGIIKALGTNRVSGIADSGIISNCYNKGSIIYGGTSSTYNGSIASYPSTSTLTNCYYLKGTYGYGLYNNADVSGSYEVKEESDFTSKSENENSVVNLLNKDITDGNNIFVIKEGVNGGYPVFTWQ